MQQFKSKQLEEIETNDKGSGGIKCNAQNCFQIKPDLHWFWSIWPLLNKGLRLVSKIKNPAPTSFESLYSSDSSTLQA